MKKSNLILDKTDRELFQNICSLSQPQVLHLMSKVLRKHYKDVEVTPSYIVAYGDIPVALVAHADTVFPSPPKRFYFDQEYSVMWSPDGLGADDRAGIFAIIKILQNDKLRPHIIITTDEEKGCIGASKLVAKHPKFKAPLKFLVELDRRGKEDSVYYDCDNPEFEAFINRYGFVTNYGSLSDISILAPIWKVAAVNFSVGYEDEHSYHETLNINYLYATIEKVKRLLDDAHSKQVPKFDYIEHIYSWTSSFTNSKFSRWNSSGNYRHTPNQCDMCEDGIDPEVATRVTSATTFESMELCLSCFAEVCDHILWCKECYEGWLDVNYTGLGSNYVCPRCASKKTIEEAKGDK